MLVYNGFLAPLIIIFPLVCETIKFLSVLYCTIRWPNKDKLVLGSVISSKYRMHAVLIPLSCALLCKEKVIVLVDQMTRETERVDFVSGNETSFEFTDCIP